MIRTLVVSPHLDDAVFSAGEFLASRPESVVVTMLAGAPDPPVVTEWDTDSGFASSQESLEARWREDEAALAELHALPVHLGFLDGQYEPADIVEMAGALRDVVDEHRPDVVVGPLGVHHDDHERVRDAVLAADLDVPLYLYADLPYSCYRARDAWRARLAIRRRGFSLRRESLSGGACDLKTAAVRCYPTQVKQFELNKILVPERFWRVRWRGAR